MGAQTTIDILVPSARGGEVLRRCLRSLEAAAQNVRGRAEIRILVLFVGTIEREALAEELQSPGLLHCWFEQAKLSAAAARNVLLPHAKAEWLFFIDDDAFVDGDFFVHFVENYPKSTAAVIGGPNLTPKDSSKFQRASGAALSSRLGAHDACARYAPRLARSIVRSDAPLILCNLFFRRDALKGLCFPEALRCNEENWVMQDLLRRGGEFIYDPRLSVRHERRGSFLGFAAQIHGYGIGRGQNIRYRPDTLNIFHLVPSLSLGATLMLLVLGYAVPTMITLWVGLFVIYLCSIALATVRMRGRMQESIDVCLLAALLFPLIHCTYGAGVLRGLMAHS